MEKFKVCIEIVEASALSTYLLRSRQDANKPISWQQAWDLLSNVARTVGITGCIGTHTMRNYGPTTPTTRARIYYC